MRKETRMNLLGAYDGILALGAIYTGVMMILSKSGVFLDFPKEWLSKLPFTSWVVPGILVIAFFGLGNAFSALSCFKKDSQKSIMLSVIMGGILFCSLIAQVIILGEWYLATAEFFIVSLTQLFLCGYTISGSHRKLQKA